MDELADDLTDETPEQPEETPAPSSRLTLLGFLLLIAAVLVSVGTGVRSLHDGLIAGGITLAAWSYLFFGDVT